MTHGQRMSRKQLIRGLAKMYSMPAKALKKASIKSLREAWDSQFVENSGISTERRGRHNMTHSIS